MAISSYPSSELPIGSMIMWPATSPPTGWLLCDGGLHSIANYAALYALIGTTFGSVVANQFRVPDLKSRVPYGKNNATVIGQINQISLGSHSHTIAHNHSTGNQSSNHTHGNTGNNSANHQHAYQKPNATNSNANTGNQSANHSHGTGNNSASHSHTTTSQSGNTSGNATVGSPGDLVVNFIIKAF